MKDKLRIRKSFSIGEDVIEYTSVKDLGDFRRPRKAELVSNGDNVDPRVAKLLHLLINKKDFTAKNHLVAKIVGEVNHFTGRSFDVTLVKTRKFLKKYFPSYSIERGSKSYRLIKADS